MASAFCPCPFSRPSLQHINILHLIGSLSKPTIVIIDFFSSLNSRPLKYLQVYNDLDSRCFFWDSLFLISLGGPDVFPRINIKDPYKRLGISREASEEEIQAARNFLINKYGGHQPSVDAIESAHDQIIMRSFYERKNPKINIKKKVREFSQSRIIKAITSRFETPATNVILKTASAFTVLGILTVLFPTEEGPTLQVAISLVACIYFMYGRLKSKLRAFLYG